MSTPQFKKRLRLLIRAAYGSELRFTAAIKRRGHSISNATVNRWVKEDSTVLPSVADLMVIVEMEPDVSADYLIGNKPAETTTEKFIEERLK